MKKTFTILMALMVLCFSQCKKPNNEEIGGKVKVSCTIPINNGEKSDFTNLMDSGKINWSDGRECVYLAIHGSNPQIIELESWADGTPSKLEFEGEAAEDLITSGEEYDIWYFGHSHQLETPYYNNDGDSLTGSISNQTGRLEDLGYCHIAKTKVIAVAENGEVKLNLKGTLSNQIAIALLDLENVEELYGDAIIGTEYTLSYKGERYELEVTEDDKAKIDVESASGISYVVLLPNTNKETMIKHKKEDKTYAYTFHNGIKGNKLYYRSGIDGTTAEALRWEEIDEEEPDTPSGPPAVPTNLVATATGRKTISLTWDAAQNATSYKVYSNDSLIASGLTATTYTVGNLAAGTEYCYYVTAVNKAGESEASTVACATTESGLNGHECVDLGLPSGLLWATCNVGASSPEKYGNYYAWGETEPAPGNNYSSSNCSVHGLSISQLQSQGYIDGEGNLTLSHDAARANWGGSWRMPTKAECQELIDNCTWTWTTQNGVNCYKVASNTNSNYIFLPAAGYRNGSSSYSVTSFGTYWSSTPIGSDAYYLTFNSNNYHDMLSNERHYGRSVRPVIGEEEPTAPAAPTNLVATATGQTTISLTWNAVQNATSYKVYNGENVVVSDLTATTYTVENLTAGTEYCYYVTAVNEDGESAASTTACATTEEPEEPEEPTAPAAPTNLVATATGQTTISLTWDAVKNATSYKVYNGETVVVEGLTATSYTVENLTAGTQYCYNVTAVNEAGESAASTSACATTESVPTAPAAPTNLVATATGQTTISLTWAAVHNATNYNVYSNDTLVVSGLTATTYTVEGLTAGTQYCYNVTAVNEIGESEHSTEACATTEEAPIVIETFTVNGVSFNMIQVEGGGFTMGHDSEGYSAIHDEEPHYVTLDGFSIGETEVTQELWKAVMGSDSHASWAEYMEYDDYYPQRPAEFISWDDCQTFISKLNELTGKNFRLPTEAEWEYAARGGHKAKERHKYSGSNNIDEVAWYYGNHVAENYKTNTHDVKTKKANELGAYDMTGNVWEWCNDWHDPDYYWYSPTHNPQGPATGTARVYRGAGWGDTTGTSNASDNCRVAKRRSDEPDSEYSNVGFRLCL